MGINAEMVRIAADLRSRELCTGHTILEFGAQDLCAAPEVVDYVIRQHGIVPPSQPLKTPAEMYATLGFTDYTAIDAGGQNGALLYDLNRDLKTTYGFDRQFDVVTNLGTSEHCFNQFQVFKNLHDACRKDGLMIHAVPSQGNANHGFYNYQPRFFADLAAANRYGIVRIDFTVDYMPQLHAYSLDTYKKYDSRDLMLYVVLRKTDASEFQSPFDGMFSSSNLLTEYNGPGDDPLKTTFSPYLKGGSWEGTLGYSELPWHKQNSIGARILNRFKSMLS